MEGHPLSIEFQPARSPKSHLLNVYLSLAGGGQAAIGLSRPLLECRDCSEVSFSEPDLANLRVFAADEAWIRAVLADASTQAALAGLIHGDAWRGLSEVYLKPDRLWLRAHPRLAQDDSVEWLPALMILARAVESAPASRPR